MSAGGDPKPEKPVLRQAPDDVGGKTQKMPAPPPPSEADAGPHLLGQVREACQKHADRAAIKFRRNDAWDAITYRQLWQRVMELSLGFRGAGVTKDDRVLIVAENGPEVLLAELAAVANRAMAVVLHPRYAPAVLREITAQVQPRLAIVESGAPLARFLDARRDAADRLRIVSFGDGVPGPRGEIRALSAMLADGKRRLERAKAEGSPDPFEGLLERIRPSDAIAIAYTAGTTRSPRGAVLTHANAVGNPLVKLFGLVAPHDVALMQIPLAQPFARLNICYGLLRAGATTALWSSREGLFLALEKLHPTMLFLAPGAIEPLEAEIKRQFTSVRQASRRLIDWALESARRARQENAPLPRLADWLVLSRIRKRLGKRIRWVFVGGAADGNVLSFFQDIGIDTYEGYTIAEATPVIALNRPEGDDVHRFAQGVVGRAVPGVEVKMDEAGELLVRGVVPTRGYWRDDAATAEALPGDRWLRTGDMGFVNEHGYIVVEDRRADMFPLADGRYVAPAVIEEAVKGLPLVKDAVIVGRGRPYPVALVFPRFQALAERVFPDAGERAALAAKRALKGRLLSSKDARALVEDEVLMAARRAKVPEYAIPKRVRLLSMTFTDAIELTPVGTLRRATIEERFQGQIEQLYAERLAPAASAATS